MNKKIFFVYTALFGLIIFGFIVVLLTGSNKGRDYPIHDVRIFKSTEAWELAKAVDKNNPEKIDKICKEHPEWVNVVDEKKGMSFLIWAVGMEKYEAVEALLKNGADVNYVSPYTGGTALYLAAGYSWVDVGFKQDSKYVKILLEYGADPNICYKGAYEKSTVPHIGDSPLMASLGCGIEKTKLLVEYGADINYQIPKSLYTVAIFSIGFEKEEYADYLINECGADITRPYYVIGLNDKYFEQCEENKKYPIDLLEKYPFDRVAEGTYEYEVKMRILETYKKQMAEK